MNLKDFLYGKKIKQVQLARDLMISPSRISMHVNGVMPLPEKHQELLAAYLGFSIKELKEMQKYGPA